VLNHPAHPYTQRLLSAVPDPRAGLRATRPPARKGAGASIQVDEGGGCPFVARCPHAMDVCREVMPEVTPVNGASDGRHWTRCHLMTATTP
jgi:oligopeptide/dipeptide ABC transporter ATP-binding protein